MPAPQGGSGVVYDIEFESAPGVFMKFATTEANSLTVDVDAKSLRIRSRHKDEAHDARAYDLLQIVALIIDPWFGLTLKLVWQPISALAGYITGWTSGLPIRSSGAPGT